MYYFAHEVFSMSSPVSRTRALVECAMMVAIASVLSMIKLIDLPYGGSVTIASMLPIVILSYRHGPVWGLGSGLVYGVVQQLLGLNTLSWVSSWQSVVAIILLDYIIAFAVIGLAGVFHKMKRSSTALVCGSILACLLRYTCHVIAGATVWAGLSIPNEAALLYSLAYNATYMLPETIVLVIVAYYLGSSMDLRRDQPIRVARTGSPKQFMVKFGSGLLFTGMMIYDVSAVFSKLQNAETGDFFIQGIHDVNWVRIAVISAICLIGICVLMVYGKTKTPEEE